MRGTLTAVAVMAWAGVMPATASAQWLDYPTAGIPRLPDGRPDLAAPAPRTADGKPDISGLWLPSTPHVLNMESGLGPGRVPFKPWAETLFRRRFETFGHDDPSARCIPGGVPRLDLIPYRFRIISAPGRTVILYEISQVWREIFTDGRHLPKDADPAWMGYSVGRWDGGTFVVRTSGFNGKAWLDTEGHPTTDALEVTERFRRKDFGHMELAITIDDPKAYTDTWTLIVPLSFYADTELMEYVCSENNQYRHGSRQTRHLLKPER